MILFLREFKKQVVVQLLIYNKYRDASQDFDLKSIINMGDFDSLSSEQIPHFRFFVFEPKPSARIQKRVNYKKLTFFLSINTFWKFLRPEKIFFFISTLFLLILIHFNECIWLFVSFFKYCVFVKCVVLLLKYSSFFIILLIDSRFTIN